LRSGGTELKEGDVITLDGPKEKLSREVFQPFLRSSREILQRSWNGRIRRGV
jgi:hypothetical protein